MPFRDPLTSDHLAEIRARYEMSPRRAPCSYQDAVVWKDVLALLFEIKRLRLYPLEIHQVRTCIRPTPDTIGGICKEMVDRAADEPCVRENEMLKAELLNPDAGTGKRTRGLR
ncbi:hypothetical protein [Achromobacter aloeverae]